MPQSVGARIGHARRLLGVFLGRDVTVPDLAKLTGVSAESAYNWEAGAIPAPRNLTKLAEVLRVSVPWLHYGIDPNMVLVGSMLLDRRTLKQFSEAELDAAEQKVADLEAAERGERAAAPRPPTHAVEHPPLRKANGGKRRRH